MRITKGQKLAVTCSRKGKYNAEATQDFDTEIDEWYHVKVDQDKIVEGLNDYWINGDSIPCRRGQARIVVR